MPLYEYECTEHGLFEAQRPVSESKSPGNCPDCGRAGPRRLSVPHLSRVARSERVARDRNEQSRHEPRVVSRAPPAAPRASAEPLLQASGSRPWAIGH